MKSIHDPRYVEMVARLRAAREQRGYSQADLARLLGKPQSYVSKIETCERRLDLIETLQFCQTLNLKLEAIIPAELRSFLPHEGVEDGGHHNGAD